LSSAILDLLTKAAVVTYANEVGGARDLADGFINEMARKVAGDKALDFDGKKRAVRNAIELYEKEIAGRQSHGSNDGDSSLTQSGSVFISYRREDSSGIAGRIYDRLVHRLGRDRVFFDVDDLSPGVDFEKILSQKVSACDSLVAIIGKYWLTTVDESGQRRLESPLDFVRIEIETALGRGILVIPVLVDGAVMPRRENLPGALKPLAERQGVEISHTRFNSDAKRLIGALRGPVVRRRTRARESGRP
jgi:hypothetical protein